MFFNTNSAPSNSFYPDEDISQSSPQLLTSNCCREYLSSYSHELRGIVASEINRYFFHTVTFQQTNELKDTFRMFFCDQPEFFGTDVPNELTLAALSIHIAERWIQHKFAILNTSQTDGARLWAPFEFIRPHLSVDEDDDDSSNAVSSTDLKKYKEIPIHIIFPKRSPISYDDFRLSKDITFRVKREQDGSKRDMNDDTREERAEWSAGLELGDIIDCQKCSSRHWDEAVVFNKNNEHVLVLHVRFIGFVPGGNSSRMINLPDQLSQIAPKGTFTNNLRWTFGYEHLDYKF